MGFLVALKFLTIIPLFRQRQDSVEEMGGSLVYYPLVGFIIGIILVALNLLFDFLLPPAVAKGLLIVSLVILTGALHLDGFIDTCDGIAGHKPVEERWRIMHDSRSGAFGVVGAVLLLLVQYVSLNNVPAFLITPALVLMPLLSRWAMVYAIFAYPYARPEGLGKTIKQAATWQRFTIATAIALALATWLAWPVSSSYPYLSGPVMMLGTWVIITIVAAFFERMFAGLTGDNYGAINEIAEVGVLLMIILLTHNRWLI